MKHLLVLLILLPTAGFGQDSLALHPQSSIEGNWTLYVDSTRLATGSRLAYSFLVWPGDDTLTIYDIADPAHPSLIDQCFPTTLWYVDQYMHGGGSTHLGGVCLWDDLVIVTHNRAVYAVYNTPYQWIGPLKIIAKPIGEPDNLWEITLVDSIFEWMDPDSGTGWNDYILPGNLTRYGDYLFVAAGSWGVRIIDLSDPASPQEMDTLGLETKEIAIDGNRLITYGYGRLAEYDLSEPTNPDEIGVISVSERARIDLRDMVRGYLYGALYDSLDYKWVLIFSLQGDNAPEEVGRFDTGIIGGGDLAVSQDYLLIKHERAIHLYNLEEPASPESLGIVLVDSAAYDELAAFNNLLFLGCGYADQEWGWEPDVPRATIQIYDTDFDAVPPSSLIPHPSSFILYPAYPNPFNSATTIKYGLPCSGNVTLRIYNPLGQQVSTLFEGYQSPGFHTTTLTADDLPSGLYFVRLDAGNEKLTQKVMLVK